MSENSALEETIRRAVTETLKSLTPEQLRELTMEPYESGPEPEEVHDISSLPREPEYPREFAETVILSSEKLTNVQRTAIVQYLVGEGVETFLFGLEEPKTFDSPPTEEGLAIEYGELAQYETEEAETDE